MIKGVLLQNFMSYENAFIPLKNGLNLICGPNGAGKSSILLAISIVLGQTHTERSRKLSDFIRWGKNEARITLQIDNRRINGKRPFPNYRVDIVKVTRVLKKNGGYFYLVQGNKVQKNVVIKAFDRFGLNPDNMLIIMHQLMAIKFSSVSPQDKLKMLEEAIGFQSYRQHVLGASERLKKVVSEEKSLTSMLETTKETHHFWKKEHEKYVKKKKLEVRLRELQCEFAWAKVEKKENAISQLGARSDSRKKMLNTIEDRFFKAISSYEKQEASFKKIRQESRKLGEEKLEIARDESSCEVDMTWARRILQETENEISILKKEQDVRPNGNNARFLKGSEEGLMKRWYEMETMLKKLKKELKKIRNEQTSIQKQSLELEKILDKTLPELIQAKVNVEILSFKKNLLGDELKELKIQMKIMEEELEPILKEADELGPRFESIRKIIDIARDLGIAKEQFRHLASVSEDVERMYKSSTGLYGELKDKAKIVARNRKMTLIELNKRLGIWRKAMNSFLSELNVIYNNILAEVGATGLERLVNEKEMEKAGLELLVGFSGREPVSLDSLAQSGGERSVALMAFLLALQQHLISPFRAIDEFDVHMDPRNREVISHLIISSARKLGSGQYIAITPGQIRNLDENVHVIIVQNVGGSSTVSELK